MPVLDEEVGCQACVGKRSGLSGPCLSNKRVVNPVSILSRKEKCWELISQGAQLQL